MDQAEPNFTGYWRQVKNEYFDDYMKVLGLPWAIRKLANRFAAGSTDVIWQRGKQMRVTTVNSKGAWTRLYTEGKEIYQKNAAGEPVRIKTWWEGKVHKCRATGSSFGVLESWRYMEDHLMVVRSKVISPDQRTGEMYWFFEELPPTNWPPHRAETRGALLKRVWADQSLVERATRKDNLHLQVLLHDLARWETPADNYFHMVANAATSADERVGWGLWGVRTTIPPPPPQQQQQREGTKSRATSRPGSPASSQQGGQPPRSTIVPSSAAATAAMSASSSAVELAVVMPDDTPGRPPLPPTQPPARGAGHRRVLSDPASVRSDAAGSVSDVTGTVDLPPGSVQESSAAPMPGSDGGMSDVQGVVEQDGLQVGMVGGSGVADRRARLTEAVASCSQVLVIDSDAGGSGMESPVGGMESGGVGSPLSIKSVDAPSGRSATSGAIRATPRGTPMPSMDQNDLEKILAWKIHEFKDVRGIASVLPVKGNGEPELLEMSPEQAEQTHIKLQELEELARLRRHQRSRSFSCCCCMISMHDYSVPDYLRAWEM